MKLAEALQERADLNRKIGQLTARLEANARVQDGEKPTEDPVSLLSELDACIARLDQIIRHKAEIALQLLHLFRLQKRQFHHMKGIIRHKRFQFLLQIRKTFPQTSRPLPTGFSEIQ